MPESIPKRIGYADPPYPGNAHLYSEHPDFAGEVNHVELIHKLNADYDGWVLHTSSTALPQILPLCVGLEGVRYMAWVKPFAAFKKNVSVAYAWEPVIVKAARKPVCHWAFEMLGARPEDVLDDLFPGTGAVSRAWVTWQKKFTLPQ